MKRFLCTLGLTALSLIPFAQDAPATKQGGDPRFFEMRTYYAAPGKLDELNARFRNHTLRLFKKHGMENIGYWMPVDNPDHKLIYVLAYPNREARESAWKAFFADPDWQKAAKASEVNGKLVDKVESIFLKATDYSPTLKPVRTPEPRLFELRTYTAASGKLGALNKRFREKTLGLFTKHGMMNVGYWVPVDKKQGADDTLIYIVAHKDQDAASASWNAFRSDFDWVAAKKFSEADGPLTVTNGVRSVFLKPTDYSPMK